MARTYNSNLVELGKALREVEAELALNEYESNLEDAIEQEFEDEYEWEDKQKEGFLSKLGKGKAAAVGAMMRILGLINPLPEPAIPPKPVPTETRSHKSSAGQGEFEWELEAQLDQVRSRDAEMMEYLGRAATETESEAEAAAFIGALLPVADRIISGVTPVLTRNSPELLRGLVAATQALRRNPDTRPLVRTIPTIVRRTAANMNQQLQQGMPVTQKTALQSLARQTQALLSSPQQSIQALQHSQGVIPHHRNFLVKNRSEDRLELEIALQEIEHIAGSSPFRITNTAKDAKRDFVENCRRKKTAQANLEAAKKNHQEEYHRSLVLYGQPQGDQLREATTALKAAQEEFNIASQLCDQASQNLQSQMPKTVSTFKQLLAGRNQGKKPRNQGKKP